ncbi:MAG TPA: hypothetical protein VNK04_26980 [Gemmataceae bacterium]|nr:hypothetical protein [Gemmataceae bacterium]
MNIAETPLSLPPARPGPLRRRAFLAACALLLGLIGLAYHTALRHVPRCDQWILLLDTIDHHEFLDLVAHSYSYSRTRIIYAGDTQLFRPLFFVLLAAERVLFGTDFRLWHGAGILLHFLAVCLFLAAMLRAQALAAPGTDAPEGKRLWRAFWPPLRAVPYALALFFAVNYAVVEQVVWFNVNGYIVFVILILGSILLLMEAADPNATRRRQAICLTGAWLLTLTAAFVYEMGQFYAVVAGLFVAVLHHGRGERRRGAVLLAAFVAVVLLYQAVNQFDRWYQQGRYTDDVALSDLARRAFQSKTLKHTARYAVFAIVQPFLPLHVRAEIHPMGKCMILEPVWDGELKLDRAAILSLSVLGLWAALTLLGAGRLLAGRKWGALAIAVLPIGAAAVHMALVVLGRINLRDAPIYLQLNCYYVYISLLFVLLGSAALLPGLHMFRRPFAVGALQGAGALLVMGLVMLGAYSAAKTHQINADAARMFKPQRRLIDSLRRFVAEHQHEPGFSFALQLDPVRHVPSVTGIPYPVILYKRYITNADPKYVIWFDNWKVFAVPADEWRRTHPGGEAFLCPELVQIGAKRHIFRYGDSYYALPYAQAHQFLHSPDRAHFPGALKDTSLEGLLRQIETSDRR